MVFSIFKDNIYIYHMIKRLLEDEILTLMSRNPAVAILGARQVGKTTLAKRIALLQHKEPLYLDLENPVDVRRLDDAYTFFSTNKDRCLIIDEIQTIPALFSVLRSAIDENRRNGRFILLGSASPQLVKGVSESLAGGIAYRELSPVNYAELPSSITREKHWLRGGFPPALTARSNKASSEWMRDFIRSYVERDLNFLFGIDLTSNIIRRILSMLSHVNGAVWNAEMMARSLGLTAPTVNRYIDFLEGAFLIHRLPSFFINTRKRLVKSPKIYIRDSGLLHQLSGVSDMMALKGHPVIGSSWEGYILEQIYQLKPPGTELYYYRTQAGAECDIVIAKGVSPLACVEVKLNNAPHISKGNLQGIDDMKTKKNFVVVPDVDEYKASGNITVCNTDTFLSKYLPKIK